MTDLSNSKDRLTPLTLGFSDELPSKDDNMEGTGIRANPLMAWLNIVMLLKKVAFSCKFIIEASAGSRK